MGAVKPKLVVLGACGQPSHGPDVLSWPLRAGGYSNHPCECCKCCACQKACNKCRDHCCPMESNLIPVVYCPDFADIRALRPTRYLYRSDYSCEYRLHLPGMR